METSPRASRPLRVTLLVARAVILACVSLSTMAEPCSREPIDAPTSVELAELAARKASLRAEVDQRLSNYRAEMAKLEATRPRNAEREARLQHMRRTLARVEENLRELDLRVHYLTPTTTEEPFKSYLSRLTHRIEQYGTENWPTDNGERVYGCAIAEIRIRADGWMKWIKMVPSHAPYIERYVPTMIASLTKGSFETFPPEMAALADEVVLMLPFKYAKRD